ncbi:hypothetical protein J5N97_024723 [Dioscorea zingiberensis]|uniref:HMA domain-containing protein n=1 Tax=Dioscorea zingiberensis TaxID=325984 RepID=A0A9D5C781_9LILI|nr:hypothetical protein J5N97_024723 [Dioscorea zingiberensis]
MGEEQIEEGEKKKEEEEEASEIVLKVDMHCEGCAKKVAKALRGFQGVEDVKVDCMTKKVVIKGKALDPNEIYERVQRKTNRKIEVISPLPKSVEEEKKVDAPKDKKKEEPKAITVILKVHMHCEACAQVIQKKIKKVEGVESARTDLLNNEVIVKGNFDPTKIVEYVYRRTKKQASIVKDEKKEEESEEKKEEEKEKGDEDEKNELKKFKHYLEYYYSYSSPPPQIFSDENPNACSIM